MKTYRKTLPNTLAALFFLLLSSAVFATPADFQCENLTRIESSDAEIDFSTVDQFALNVPRSAEKSIESLAAYLVEGTHSELERCRAAFRWMTKNISYDDVAYNTGDFPSMDAQTVFKRRKGVCAGFSHLYNALCKSMELQSASMVGYAKGYGYKSGDKFKDTNHAWNLVKADGKWRLMDVTWGEGYGKTVNGKLKSVKEFDNSWFDVDPYAFLFTHYPKNKKALLIPDYFTKEQFAALPEVPKSLFASGFPAKAIFHRLQSGKLNSIPKAYRKDHDLRWVKAPLSGELSPEKEYTFLLESDAINSVVLIENGVWHQFEQRENRFLLKYTPAKNSKGIRISVSKQGRHSTHMGILDYQVKGAVKPEQD